MKNEFLTPPGRALEELNQLHGEAIEKVYPIRHLVENGKPLCPEGRALLRQKNAKPPVETTRENWLNRQSW
ncbi:MAG: hypothetical protein KGL39_41255 [Patescibacteria group bacterium]|nr:hypothetical protein [Patescibacteria group bacterium]